MKTSFHRRPRAKPAESAARRARPAKAASKKKQPITPTNASDADSEPAAGGRAPRFPVVGIGASAGGLEALEQFLKAVPEHSGTAYVVIQHLDPTHKGAMVELLQRQCAMPVVEVKDRLRVKPDCVYVIPPNKNMSMLRGTLHLVPQDQPRGLNLPIDFFFRSLADDQQERSVGVILSGMGSDGTLGLRAITGKAGAGFVQSPTLAKFDSMPHSAIEAGLADKDRDAFLAVLSHELRNPLAPMRTGLFMLSRPDATDAQRRTALAIVNRQATHLTRLVEDLLDITRIDRGRMQLRRTSPGGPGRLLTRGSHRSGHAGLPHPARQVTGSLHEDAQDV